MSNNALAIVDKTKDFLETRSQDINEWARHGVDGSALTRYAVQELRSNYEIHDATPESVYTALLSCAVTGLVPGSLRQECFLVPFNRNLGGRGRADHWVKEAKFMVGYRGLEKQALRSGAVLAIDSYVIHEHDEYRIRQGDNPGIDHSPCMRPERGAMIGAYAVARLSNGTKKVEWLPMDEIVKIRAAAEARGRKSEPWEKWFSEMARKSAIRRLAKHLPLGDDYFFGVRLESARYAGDDGDGESDLEALDSITNGAATRGRVHDVRALAEPLPAPAQAPVAASVTAPEAAPPPARKPRSAGKDAARPAVANDPPPPAPASAISSKSDKSPASSATATASSSIVSPTDGANSSTSPAAADSDEQGDGFPDIDEEAPRDEDARTVNAMIAWAMTCRSRAELHESGSAQAWKTWLNEAHPDREDPERARYKAVFNAQWGKLPPK